MFCPTHIRHQLSPYLPSAAAPPTGAEEATKPFVTLTYAQSLDGGISAGNARRTILSGLDAYGMTHFLRSQHEGICIGVTTLLADNPRLNCLLQDKNVEDGDATTSVESDKESTPAATESDETQPKTKYRNPRPVIIDPTAKWDVTHTDSRMLQLARDGLGQAPWIVCSASTDVPKAQEAYLKSLGGQYLRVPQTTNASEDSAANTTLERRLPWSAILRELHRNGLRSLMVEGGRTIINTLLDPAHQPLVDSVIVTVAPRYLGQGLKLVQPARDRWEDPAAAVLDSVTWIPIAQDIACCGRFAPIKEV